MSTTMLCLCSHKGRVPECTPRWMVPAAHLAAASRRRPRVRPIRRGLRVPNALADRGGPASRVAAVRAAVVELKKERRAMGENIHQELTGKRWVHSHEEDKGGQMIFRPATYRFPPSRGRTSFQLNADGTLLRNRPGPTDQTQA